MVGKMLIRIPETPGIPAVLREIAALCPRHSSTAATRLFSFLSLLWSDRPTDRSTRVRVCACTRYISRTGEVSPSELREYGHAFSRTHFPSLAIPPPLQAPTPPLTPTTRGPWAAVDFSRWKGRLVMARDISAIPYNVRRVFPVRKCRVWKVWCI